MVYAKRDARELEPHYSKHVAAITAEELHAKSDFAAELAFRDARIDQLTQDVERLREYLEGVLGDWDLDGTSAGYRRLESLLKETDPDRFVEEETCGTEREMSDRTLSCDQKPGHEGNHREAGWYWSQEEKK